MFRRILLLSLGLCLWSGTTGLAEDVHWEPCGWGGGGFFWSTAWHPGNPDKIYLGGDVAGMYRTDNKGKQWNFCNKGLLANNVYCLAVTPAAPDTVYALTTYGLFRSKNGGDSWTYLEKTDKKKLNICAKRNDTLRSVAVDPKNADVVYAGSGTGCLFKSTDGGENWTELKYAGSDKMKGSVSAVVLRPELPGAVYVTNTKLGAFVSKDGGSSWKQIYDKHGARSIAASTPDGKTLFLGLAKNGSILKSTDSGATWQGAAAGVGDDLTVNEILAPTPQRIYALCSKGWGGAFFRSDDGGATWSKPTKLEADHSANPTGAGEKLRNMSKIINLSYNPQNIDELFIAGNWRNFFSADGGKTWQERTRGADISCITDVQFFQGDTYVTVMDEGLFVSKDNGTNWKQLMPLKWDRKISGHHWRVRVADNNGEARILSTYSPWDIDKNDTPNRVMRSEDSGKSFTAITEGLPSYLPKANTMWGRGYPRAMAQDPSNPNVLYLGIDGDPVKGENDGGGIFKSTDGGKSWKKLPQQPGSRRMFYGLVVDPTNPKRIFCGACNKGGVYRSEDGGNTWKKVFDKEDWVFNLEVAPDGTVYAGHKILWKSTDHGETWKPLMTDGKNIEHTKWAIVGIAIDPEDPDRIWISRSSWGAGSFGDIQETLDGGLTWKDIRGDIPCPRPLVLRYNQKTKQLWAAGPGMFKLKR